jgi:hypothetical protein
MEPEKQKGENTGGAEGVQHSPRWQSEIHWVYVLVSLLQNNKDLGEPDRCWEPGRQSFVTSFSPGAQGKRPKFRRVHHQGYLGR